MPFDLIIDAVVDNSLPALASASLFRFVRLARLVKLMRCVCV